MGEDLKQALLTIKEHCAATSSCTRCVLKDFLGCFESSGEVTPCVWDVEE